MFWRKKNRNKWKKNVVCIRGSCLDKVKWAKLIWNYNWCYWMQLTFIDLQMHYFPQSCKAVACNTLRVNVNSIIASCWNLQHYRPNFFLKPKVLITTDCNKKTIHSEHRIFDNFFRTNSILFVHLVETKI